MSAKATFWAWQQYIKPATAKLVLLCLSDCHNGDNGQCNPSIPYISKMTGLDKKTVMTGIGRLEEIGAIEAVKKYGQGTHYRLHTSTEIGTTNNGSGTENGSTVFQPNQYHERERTSTKNGTRTYKEPKKESTISPRFIPPTLQEVEAYCFERGNRVDPETFVDHYAANGWVRGKNKIRDWRACVRTWEKSERDRAGDNAVNQELVF